MIKLERNGVVLFIGGNILDHFSLVFPFSGSNEQVTIKVVVVDDFLNIDDKLFSIEENIVGNGNIAHFINVHSETSTVMNG